MLLHQEQSGQHHDRDGNHITAKLRGYDIQALDGRQHRNGGRDHAVAINNAAANIPSIAISHLDFGLLAYSSLAKASNDNEPPSP